jgi:hypothetical protein
MKNKSPIKAILDTLISHHRIERSNSIVTHSNSVSPIVTWVLRLIPLIPNPFSYRGEKGDQIAKKLP